MRRLVHSSKYSVFVIVTDRKIDRDFLFTRQTPETYEELNKAFVWFTIVLSSTGLYMYKKLMTTEAGKLLNGMLLVLITLSL